MGRVPSGPGEGPGGCTSTSTGRSTHAAHSCCRPSQDVVLRHRRTKAPPGPNRRLWVESSTRSVPAGKVNTTAGADPIPMKRAASNAASAVMPSTDTRTGSFSIGCVGLSLNHWSSPAWTHDPSSVQMQLGCRAHALRVTRRAQSTEPGGSDGPSPTEGGTCGGSMTSSPVTTGMAPAPATRMATRSHDRRMTGAERVMVQSR